MAFKFNPFTGTFDEVGTGGGGGVPDPLTLNELTVNTLLTADHIHGNLAGSVYIHVKNTDSVQLDAGTPFYITGTVGASDRVEIQKADSSDPAKGPAVGVLETTLAVNGEGNGVILGEIFNFDTATPGWSTNDELYVANGGGLTNVKPTSGYRQIVAYVGRVQASTGTLVLTGTSIDPVAGSNGQIQFNDNGGFGADTGLTFDKTTDQLTVGGDINLDSGGSFSTTIQSVTPTANRTISFPDQTGTVGLVSGATGNIQYNNAGQLAGTTKLNTELDWTSATGTYTGLKVNVDDGAGGAPAGTGNLLDLQNNGTSKFSVDTDGRINLFGVSGFAAFITAGGTRTGVTGFVDFFTGAQVRSYIAVSEGNGANANRLYSEGAGTLSQRNGTAAQAYRLYNTYTSATDYERLSFNWDTNVFKIKSEAAGTGTVRGIQLGSSSTEPVALFGATPVAQPTTAVGSAAIAGGGGTAVDDATTFGGYTLAQVVQALQNLGILA